MAPYINFISLRFTGFSNPVFQQLQVVTLLLTWRVWSVGNTTDRNINHSTSATVHSCYNTLEFVVALSLIAPFTCFSPDNSGVLHLAVCKTWSICILFETNLFDLIRDKVVAFLFYPDCDWFVSSSSGLVVALLTTFYYLWPFNKSVPT